MLEEKIKTAIKDRKNFEYYRNPGNLGFVKTCNRAVFELDKSGNDIMLLNSDTAVTHGFLAEMQKVLYARKDHGAVSPRSNSAGPATIPLKPLDRTEPAPEQAYKIFQEINQQLNDYTEAVDAHGFCMLVKREIIKEYGLFDEIYSPGYAEETDFSMRIRRRGYKCLFANHAFVFHYRAETFTSERKAKLKSRNKKILHERYPEVEGLVLEYFEKVDPMDWFADLLAGAKARSKVMIDLSHLAQSRDDVSRSVDSLLRGALKSSKVQWTIVANPDVIDYFNLGKYGIKLIATPELDELFDVGYCPFPVTYPNDLTTLNKWCLKIGFRDYFQSDSLNSRLKQESIAKRVLNDARTQADFVLQDDDDTLTRLAELAKQPVELDKLRLRWRHISQAGIYSPSRNSSSANLAGGIKSKFRNLVRGTG
jgi:hypothetical protein